ncbi:MAG: lysoplasmalogenase family protein [Caulobacter sp.]|nr:lysoplasmalogenase family protein [Caulobacter sp.]
MTRLETAARLALIGSIIAGVSYIASWNMELSQAASLTWKGLGVGLLAVYAGLRARDLNGWLLAAVMTLGTLGDVLLGIQFIVGAVAFLIGHGVAVVLYLRNRRQMIQKSQLALAVLLVPATVFIAFMLPADRAGAPGVAFYTLGLSLMAATAWTSRFPRFTVGIGALLFLVSDLVIFAKMGFLPDTFLTGLAVWVPYYGGQLLICVGAVGAIAHWRETAGRERVTGG